MEVEARLPSPTMTQTKVDERAVQLAREGLKLVDAGQAEVGQNVNFVRADFADSWDVDRPRLFGFGRLLLLPQIIQKSDRLSTR